MRSGGYTPGGARYGGATPALRTVLEAFNAARGTAYDVSTSSPVWVENMALARAIADVFATNEMLGNQFDPRKVSVLLERWEKIYGITPLPTAAKSERRAALAAHVARTGVMPSYQEVVDRITTAITPVTFSISHHAPGDSGVITSWPGGWYVQSTGTSPPTATLTGTPAADYTFVLDIRVGGIVGVATFAYSTDNGASWSSVTTTASSVALGSTGLTVAFAAGTYNANNQYFSRPLADGWWSTVAYIPIVCTKPSWMTERVFYETAGRASSLLDAFLPAWVTFDFLRDGGTPGSFILDEASNLDNQRLS